MNFSALVSVIKVKDVSLQQEDMAQEEICTDMDTNLAILEMIIQATQVYSMMVFVIRQIK